MSTEQAKDAKMSKDEPSHLAHVEEPTAHDTSLGDADEICVSYTLRPQQRFNQTFTGIWLDQDETGNYDPKNKIRKSKPKRSGVKLRQRSVGDTKSPDLENDGTESEGPIFASSALFVTLIFFTESSKAKLREYLSKLPAQLISDYDDLTEGYSLRKKAIALVTHGDQSLRGVDPPADLTGHPAARGCKACLELNIACPILKDEYQYPCQICAADQQECELVSPPKIKRTCERCKARRRTCSYTYTTEHGGPCEECQEEGYCCVAGPAREGIRPRIRYGRDNNKQACISRLKKVAKPKIFWTCMQCRQAGRECSFSMGVSSNDCTACEMSGRICIPEQTTTKTYTTITSHPTGSAKQRTDSAVALLKRRSSIAGTEPSPCKRHRPSTSSEPPHQLEAGTTSGKTITITTSFSHPVIFNSHSKCNFCDGSAFALIGHDTRTVEVIEWVDGRPYTETHGGHAGEGIPNTNVCTKCTMQRLIIITCKTHLIRPVPNLASQLLDVDGAYAALLEPGFGKVRAKDRWCSICPGLATYECRAEGCVDYLGNARVGCGLALCGTCRRELMVRYGGGLERMLAGLVDEPSEERPLGLRADWELLKPKGLLMRYLIWSSER